MTTPLSATATPVTASAGGSTGTSSGSGSSSGSTSPIFTLAIELVGVVVLSIVAGIGPKTGKIVALFMVGLLVLWLVLNATTLAKLMPGTNVSVQGLCLYSDILIRLVWAVLNDRSGARLASGNGRAAMRSRPAGVV